MGQVITILLGLLFGPSILLLLTKFISSRLHQFQAKLTLLKEWKLVSDVEHLNLEQVERDLSSATQDYTHAQQEEVTEETFTSILKKYLAYEVYRGELLGEAHCPPWSVSAVTIFMSCFMT